MEMRSPSGHKAVMNKRRSRSVQATLSGIERLETERRKRGFTLEALARSANVAPDTLKRLMRRERVDRSSLRDIVGVLELEPTDIVDDQSWNQWYVTDAEPSEPPQSSLPTQSGSNGAALNGAALNNAALNNAAPAAQTSEAEIAPPEPDFSLYVERPVLEEIGYQTLTSPGGLLRIKAPQHMGKTALLTRLLWKATQSHYQTVCLSFQLADRAVFADLNTFLRWFCAVIAQELGLDSAIEKIWKDIFSGSYNATLYMQEVLLNALDQPLVLALENTDLVFEHEEIATDFCKLLRNWHDLPRRGDRNGLVWQKLRLVIVHATEIYGALDINASPLAGVGVLVDLPEFTVDQVQTLVQRYDLAWTSAEIEQLMTLVGGHPYLLQLGLEQIQRQSVSLKEFLQTAATEAGVYRNHLRQQLSHLEQSVDLVQVFREVILADHPIQIKPAHAFKLQSMGLVNLEGNTVQPRCLLYCQYFKDHLQID
jgi:transcriptional regulator with XRE-family HTH domain